MPALTKHLLFARFKRLVHGLTRWSLALGMGWVLVMMILTTADVAGRYFLSKPVPGAMELSSFMLAVFAMLGMAHTHQRGANVRVTMLIRTLPPFFANVLVIISTVLTLQIVGMMAWYAVRMGLEEYHANATTDALSIPLYPLEFLLALGTLLLGLEIIVNLGDAFYRLFAAKNQG
ncbi:DctQ3 [Desulforapulum autotrophicum HRM2]|jgi:TRAP-type C4-dicarboxylate transport system permease small subunit|uniref:DctQ3 n=1 Tax=Desulforapulum autotrophicum (strain ATCC 43914 / DSM 3382 / VKM B-1955 / HRM2) TaxID=177437 RepID=C0QM26_DESAH|nr:TRAP transporter small permease [Desulforapulum autotrophicum]ACN14332.1 DctQ3 [Desulforapulum autotrophicum HRM2]